jgi:hypothetical protein
VEWDPTLPVFAVEDLGFTDSTSIWFWQHRPDGIAVIDYEEHHSEPLSFYFDLLRSKPYDIQTIFLPHDARAKSLQTGRSTIEQYLDQKDANGNQMWDMQLIPRLDLQDGVNAVRFILPHCYIDKEKCSEGIEALRAYRRSYNEVTGAYSPNPVHDWSSHGSDAFRYLALAAKEKVSSKGALELLQESGVWTPPQYTLEDLFSLNEKPRYNRNRI